MQQLKLKIEEHIANAGGVWGIVLEDLDEEKIWSLNEEEPFYAASVIKLPIMAAVFALAEQGELGLSETLPLTREDQVGGAGVLQYMTPGTRITIYDLLTLMIIQSDNTATNMLIDLVGVKHIQKTMVDLGMKRSVFYNKLMVVPVQLIERNKITATDVARLLKKFATGQSTSLHASEQMIEIMKKQQLKNGFLAYLPEDDSAIVGTNPKWQLASKSGSVTGIQHDVGIFYVGNRTMTLTALSSGCEKLDAQKALAKIGEEVYLYMVNDLSN